VWLNKFLISLFHPYFLRSAELYLWSTVFGIYIFSQIVFYLKVLSSTFLNIVYHVKGNNMLRNGFDHRIIRIYLNIHESIIILKIFFAKFVCICEISLKHFLCFRIEDLLWMRNCIKVRTLVSQSEEGKKRIWSKVLHYNFSFGNSFLSKWLQISTKVIKSN